MRFDVFGAGLGFLTPGNLALYSSEMISDATSGATSGSYSRLYQRLSRSFTENLHVNGISSAMVLNAIPFSTQWRSSTSSTGVHSTILEGFPSAAAAAVVTATEFVLCGPKALCASPEAASPATKEAFCALCASGMSSSAPEGTDVLVAGAGAAETEGSALLDVGCDEELASWCVHPFPREDCSPAEGDECAPLGCTSIVSLRPGRPPLGTSSPF
mmetsp:Transcript_44322/g.108327  ORF Transcript_44322/g.108327 Transcript_44322/m.108327 type:complete len:215 (-) Transcript_44322:336-980(-)